MKIAQKITPQTRLAELIDLIEETHHTFTRTELVRIGGLIEDPEVGSLPQLAELRACFQSLKADLDAHLQKEEDILFPYIALLDDASRELPPSCFGSVSHPIRVMQFEHIAMVGLLETLRELTNQYKPAPDSSPQTFLLFASLAAIDADLVEHMHWEDNALFPRALQEESRLKREQESRPEEPS
jgi:regulator of cell morphogenesis and NO signaling